MGAKSWNQVLRIRWRLSTGEASRRLHEAADLAARTSLTGQPLAPLLPAVAAAQSAGLITGEHVGVIRGVIKRLPSWVDTVTAGQFEVDLVRVAVGVGPKELRETADLRLFLLDQDGPEPDDAERARTRHFTTTAQGRDAMTAATCELHPADVGGVGSDLRQIRRPRHVQPRRRRAVHVGHPDPSPDRQRRSQPGSTPTRRDARGRAHRADEREPRPPQRAPGRGHHPHHPARPGKPRRHRRHRRRHQTADRRRHRHGRPRPPQPRRLRRRNGSGVGAVSRQTGRLASAADHAHRPRRRLHQTLLHRRRLRLPSPPRLTRLATRRQHQRRRHDPGLRTRQPRRRRRRLADPHQQPRRMRMDTRHPISTTANPASTTTTAPKHSCDHPKTTTPTSPHGTWIRAKHPAGPNHPTAKPPESHTPGRMAA